MALTGRTRLRLRGEAAGGFAAGEKVTTRPWHPGVDVDRVPRSPGGTGNRRYVLLRHGTWPAGVSC